MAATLATGSASISINGRETEARLIFVPSPDGDGWDASAVNKLAAEQQITAHPDPKTLDAFLAKAAKAKDREPLEIIYARGTEPEEAAEEKVNWEALPVPADMAPFQEAALAEAGLPRLFRVNVEKIKHEKNVKKPGALPFMPAKEELVVTWEKKETREEVKTDGKVREVKYADRGKKLGTVIPAVPGKPGKSVFGRPIPPNAAGSSFFSGDGIERNKNDLVAAVSGFLRIGENWADMVPLSKPSWNINTGIDGLTLFFSFEPGDVRFALPKGVEILAAAAAKSAREEDLVSAGELDAAIAGAAEARGPLKAFCLFRVREAEVRVDINPEKTRAVLYLRKGVAGALPLEMKSISQAIKNSCVRGFDAGQLKAAVGAFMQGKEIELKDYLLVEGKASTRGKDREVRISVSPLPEEQRNLLDARLAEWRKNNVSEGGEGDFDKAKSFAFVEKNSVVARVGAASEGEAGIDIFGNVIPGLPGNDPEIKLYRGLALHGSDIVAAQDGLLFFEAGEKKFRGGVIDYRDAKTEIHVSEDNMEVRGNFFREEGAGIPLTLENVQKVLSALGVKKGVDWERVKKTCAAARAKNSVSDCLLAKGEPAVAKGARAVKWLVHVEPSALSEAAPAEKNLSEENIPAGNAEAGNVQIKAGVPVAILSAALAEGRPGFDVKGNEIPVDRAATPLIEHDDSIREEADGEETRLIAARSGGLYYDGKELRIVSVKIIRGDVTPAAGNVKFSGEIRVSGNILPGCAVIGGSHITVEGVVEEALISAGGKAAAVLGVKGGGRGIIRARAGIETAFVERAAVMAVGDIYLKKGSILSSIKTNGKLFVSAENGKFSGGTCRARLGIDAADLGSEKGLRTEVSFGQDYLVKDNIGECEEEINKIGTALLEAENEIKKAIRERIPLPGVIKQEKLRLVKHLEQLKLKLFTLREKFEEHYDSEIRVRGTVFPGVVIESHDRYYEVKQKRSRVVFYFDRESGRIKEEPLR